MYAADYVAVIKRAQRFRKKLRGITASVEKDTERDEETRQTNVVVITHGVFMKFLADDNAIDLPKAGWKAFGLSSREDGGVVLAPLA